MKNETTHSADVLLVDDDPDLLKLISLRLTSAGYRVRTADSGETALAALAVARPAAVVTDLKMPGIDGLALFDAIHRQHPTLPVIILTAHGTIPEAVSATERGVFGFLTKPFDSQELLQKVASAVTLSGGEPELTPQAAGEWRTGIITRSPRMEDLLRQARLVADSDASVLIFGESGTGKELLARAIHRASRRATKAFVGVNCGAIPEPLLESELFGHARGAFSGAVQAHKGLFQAADGGTIFLDEIGDMPLALQVKLLRVLQEGEVRPVGATASIPVDVRVISATHRDLDAQKVAGEFREDLYYRLNVVSLNLPSLADRREDIPLLATHFLRKLAERYRKSVPTLAPDAMALLISAPWPGNVRQLLNLLEQAVALDDDQHDSGDARPGCVAGGFGSARTVRGSAQAVRTGLPGAAIEDHGRQRHAGGNARQAQSNRVLQAAAAASARACDVQGRQGLDPKPAPLRVVAVADWRQHFYNKIILVVRRAPIIVGSTRQLGRALVSNCQLPAPFCCDCKIKMHDPAAKIISGTLVALRKLGSRYTTNDIGTMRLDHGCVFTRVHCVLACGAGGYRRAPRR